MQQQNDRINHPAPNRQAGQEARQQEMNQEQEQSGQGGDTGRNRNPADNLTREARVRGGMHSAKNQQRDAFGQFAGRKGTAEDASRTVRGRRARGRTESNQSPGEGNEERGESPDNR